VFVLFVVLSIISLYSIKHHWKKTIFEKVQPISEGGKYKKVIDILDNLSVGAGIPKPKLYVMDSSQINAFTMGKSPKDASIIVTSRLLQDLTDNEIEGVLGHEIAHIKAHDIKLGLIAAFISKIADFGRLTLTSIISKLVIFPFYCFFAVLLPLLIFEFFNAVLYSSHLTAKFHIMGFVLLIWISLIAFGKESKIIADFTNDQISSI